jgi:hypothetical protein
MEVEKNRRGSIGQVAWPKHFKRVTLAAEREAVITKIKREEVGPSLFISFSFLQRRVNLL